jgi:hypothetical protein
MIRSITKCFGLVLLVLGVACSSNQKNELPQGYLATHIFDDGSKQFVYTVDLPDSAGRGKQGNGRPGNVAGNVQGSSNRGVTGGITAGTGGGRGGRGQGARGQHSKDGLLVDSLEAELKKTNYCRKGYMELDRMTEPSQTFIKGECVDAANKRDRSEFPNEADDSTL